MRVLGLLQFVKTLVKLYVSKLLLDFTMSVHVASAVAAVVA